MQAGRCQYDVPKGKSALLRLTCPGIILSDISIYSTLWYLANTKKIIYIW